MQATGDVADVREVNWATKRFRGMVNRLEESDVIPGELLRKAPRNVANKSKRIYEILCYLWG